MGKDKQEAGMGLAEIGVNLDQLIRRGARQVIQQAIEAELAQLLEQYANVKTLTGQQTVVRNGYLPEREVLTSVGPVTVKVPKVRDRTAVCEEIAARVSRATLAVSERDLDWRHERGAIGAAGGRSEGLVGERGQLTQGAMG